MVTLDKAEELKKLKAELAGVYKNISKREVELEKNTAKLRDYEMKNKILYFGKPGKGYLGKHGKWEANLPQKELFKAFSEPNYSVFTYTGGNRGGKTFSLVSLSLACIQGRFPWEGEEKGRWIWEMLGWKPPIKIRLIGQDWEKHIKAVLVPRLKELVPESWKCEPRKNNVGVEAYWQFQTGSIEIMSNKSESDLHEGWEGHLVGYDEPPKREVRIANARGLVDYNGREVFSMTLLKEAWVDREVINALDENGAPSSDVYNVHAKIYDNIGFGINADGVTKFASKLDDDEKKARLDGVPSYKAGIILPINKHIHFLDKEPKDMQMDWVYDIMIDYHPAKPQYVMFGATDERGFKFVPLTLKFFGDGKKIADEIIKHINRYHIPHNRINIILADPLSKGGANNKNTDIVETEYDKIYDGLTKYGFRVEGAGALKALKDDGIMAIKEALMTQNGFPMLFFFKKQNEDYPINTLQQLTDWMWVEGDGGVMTPSKEDDDSCENLYRFMLLNTQWFEVNDTIEEYRSYEEQTKNKTTGY